MRTQGGCDPQIRTRPRCLYNAPTLPQVSSSYVYSFGSYCVDKQTHKQTPLKTSNVLRYATTLSNNFISHVTTKMEKSAAPVLRMIRNRAMLTNGLLYLILSDLYYARPICKLAAFDRGTDQRVLSTVAVLILREYFDVCDVCVTPSLYPSLTVSWYPRSAHLR